LLDEGMAENASKQGAKLMMAMREISQSSSGAKSLISCVRGRGLLLAVVINDHGLGRDDLAWDVCLKLADLGLLAKPTHGNIIRFAPPLVINDQQVLFLRFILYSEIYYIQLCYVYMFCCIPQLDEAIDILHKGFSSFQIK
jgi:acetylornithine/succinyldiaminopimelate/putrescine aminotransferase